MIRTIATVIRGEGLASAMRRTGERFGDALRGAALRARGTLAGSDKAAILNVAASGTATRLGGVPAQLASRLREERRLRRIALLEPGLLTLSAPKRHTRRIAGDLETGIRETIAVTGARTVHFEGMHDVPIEAVLRLIESGTGVILTLHDFSIFCARPHLFEEPSRHFCFYSQDFDRCNRCLRQTWDVGIDEQRNRRTLGRQLLSSATGLLFPSRFLLDQHRRLFSLPNLQAEVIEPGVAAGHQPPVVRTGSAIAFAGSVKRHKGAHLLPDLARRFGHLRLHIFGGGDEDLLRALRREPNITVHGYYRAGSLPSLLARYDIGLVVLPSIVPESFGLVLSEAWLAGAAVAAFDLGAQAERIRTHGGGGLAPFESSVDGLADIINDWLTGRIRSERTIPIASPLAAAQAHINFYRRLEVL
jgi:glycosyltransferase involved in cell wall biosynthesis